MMRDGKALQAATSHYLGDEFARAFVRWLEIQRSVAFIHGQLQSLPAGPHRSPIGSPRPDYLAAALVEGWRGEICHVALTDAAGKFTIRGIAPGSYKLFAFEGLAGGEFYNARFLSKHEFRGKPITVAQGGSTAESLTVIESN
jgi:Ni,Fe-hydrogenase III large subunit